MSDSETARPRSYFLRGLLSLLGMLSLPLLVYYLYFWVESRYKGEFFVPDLGELFRIPLPTLASVVIFSVWMLLHVVLQVFAPGKWREGTTLAGTTLADGSRLRYKMNGLCSFCFSLGLFILATRLGWLSPTLLYEQFGPLITTVNLFAFAFSLFLYFFGKWQYPDEERTGNFFYDYFLGTSLNPRIGSFDLKFFMESRPGLIGWIAINYSLAAQQATRGHGLTVPMYLVFAFQFLYVFDYFWNEEAILTTWDIKHENLGWMLVWGDLVWVPFTYTLQAYYLIDHGHDLPWWGIAGIVLLNMLGYLIFRWANWQKHCFRLDPEAPVWGKPPEYIRTEQGSLLLVSGWWGIARHLNYLGDLMMALAWCLPCLFESPLPYFYFFYFLILLIHRERRDHNMCRQKYGADWEQYCQRVRWRILPYVY